MKCRRFRTLLIVMAATLLGAMYTLWSPPAEAIPPFARKYEMSCAACHQGHYPRLNEFGRRFRENGYQLPAGAEDWAKAARSVESGADRENLAVFKELPLTLRGQFFGVVPVNPGDEPVYKNSVYSMISGGGSVTNDISFYFTWTPFPEPGLHQMKIGFHNLFAKKLGEGTLNLRVGRIFLFDFQRPSHRFLSPGVTAVSNVAVGANGFTFAEANDGIQIYGRPNWGPLHYELSVVAGDAPGGQERDDWKDVFARTTYTLFYNTDHQLTLGGFAYKGRSEFTTELGDLLLAQRDDTWITGVEGEFDIGRVNLFAMAYASRHSDPKNDGDAVSFVAYRTEAVYFISPRLTTSARLDAVQSAHAEELRKLELGPHITYTAAANVLTTLAWRQNLRDVGASSLVGSVDVTF